MLKLFRAFIVLFAVIALSACQTLDSVPEKIDPYASTPESTQAFTKIQKSKQKSSSRLEQIDAYIKNNPRDEKVMSAYLLKAQILKKQRQSKKACEVYLRATQLPFFYKNENQAFFELTNCHLKNNKMEEALKTLESVILNPREVSGIKKQAAQKYWNLIKKRESPLWQVKGLSYLIETHVNSKNLSIWQKKAYEILESLNQDVLVSLYESNYHKTLQGFILYQLGLKSLTEKNLTKSRRYFMQALSSSLSPDLEQRVKTKLTVLKSSSQVDRYSIGVIVPLSGRQQGIGRKILRGLNIGFDLEKDSPWKLIVMDSQAQPDVAKSATEKLIHKHNVIAVIGGVTRQTATAIADKTSEFNLTTILFSQHDSKAQNQQFIFQNVFTAESLVEKLTDTIRSGKFDINKVAILAPNDSYGQSYSKEFKKSFTDKKGEVVAIQRYKQNEVNFKNPIQKLVNLDNLDERQEEYEKLKKDYLKKHPHISKRSKKLDPIKLLKPQFDFQALFIPDSFSSLKKIEAYLKYYDIKDIYLLGTNLWSKKQIRSWSKNRPLLFVNTPIITNEVINSSDFYKEYLKVFSKSPGVIERQSFNAAAALKKAFDKRVKNSFELSDSLTNLTNIQGAYFRFDISENNTFIYPLEVFTTDE